MADIHLIGVPLDLGGGRRGVDMGPSAVRIAGIAERLVALGHQVRDRGDIVTPTPETREEGDPRKKYLHDIQAVCEALYDTALASHGAGAFPIVIGGDHSLGAGSVAASAAHARRQGQPLGLIWVDAHADMNTPQTTVSGNVHGMPLAALLGQEPVELARIGGDAPKVLPQHTVLVGIRNLDEREKQEVRASGVHVFTMKDIDRQGAAAVMEQAIALAGAGTAGIHVRPGHRARRGHARPRGTRLPRGAHGDGDAGRRPPRARPRPGRGQPGARPAEHHGRAGLGARGLRARAEDPVAAL
jgi:arginase